MSRIHAGHISGAVVRSLLLLLAAGMILSACKESAPSSPAPAGDADSPLSGGSTTIFDATSAAFSRPAPNLSAESRQKHLTGDVAFSGAFVTAPAPVRGGLGPLFNNISCGSCHPSDGRGHAPAQGDIFYSMLLRVSVPGTDADGGPLAAPGYGTQIEDHGVAGVKPEATFSVTYADSTGAFDDGTLYHLRVPTYRIDNWYAGMPAGLMFSPRVAPPVFGLGLLEVVPESSILALADELDRNGDGISGRPNYVHDAAAGSTVLGRFGWKANTPNLLQQTAAAFNADMGLTSSLFRFESCHGQVQDDGKSDDPEVSDDIVTATAHYTRTLAVPARRSLDDPQTQRGAVVFREANCSGCHVTTLKTGASPEVPELAYQEIHPYTDLLLHDMGSALADGRPDYLASGTEWRTPPLWGIGLTQLVNGHTAFLHDGRAQTLIEAIMWHGGEGARSREYVRHLSTADRNALLSFLQSL